MKAVLVFPPLASPFQPYSSLPALTAFLRSKRRHHAVQLDANIEFVRGILTRRAIRAAASQITAKLARSRRRPGGGEELLIEAALKAPVVAESIERVVADLQDEETFRDLSRLNSARRIVHDALEVISASWFPVSLAAGDSTPGARYTWAELDRWARNRVANPFRAYLERICLPKVVRTAPAVVGISISYESQLLAAITFCTILKRRLPAIPIVLGGHVVSSWQDRMGDCVQVFDWCDFLIAFEGESGLEALLSAVESRGSLDRVPNLVYRRDGRVVFNPRSFEDIDALPAPDYRGLPLKRYLSPEPVFLLSTTRGCYWSNCEFCSVSPSTRGNYRMRNPGLVLDDIRTLTTRHGARCFMLGDDCVPPKMLGALARGLDGLGISWQCEVRFETALTSGLLRQLSRAGCRNLTFGLESYSSRVLALMNKSVRHGEIRRILDDCRRAGIAFNLQLFFGFPGEIEPDARATIDFVLDEMHGAATCSFGVFNLLRGSGVARNPDRFGIQLCESSPVGPCAGVDYAPVSGHASEMKQALRRKMLRRIRYPHAAFSLDAHTLLFLHSAGVEDMARNYYWPHDAAPNGASTPGVAPGALQRLVRGSNQTISEFRSQTLVYDYDQDETVELSPLAVWVLKQFETPQPAGEPAIRAAEKASSPQEALRVSAIVNEIVGTLSARGLLIDCSGYCLGPARVPYKVT